MLTAITGILANQFRIEEELLVPGAKLDELALDSLDVVELTMAIEKEVGVQVTDDELLELQTLSGIAALVKARAVGVPAADLR